jgi:hypothetical protein
VSPSRQSGSQNSPWPTRRRFLAGTLGAALAGAGIYELVDRLSDASPTAVRSRSPERAAVAGVSEQHLVDLELVLQPGPELVVPPLHHAVVTARIQSGDGVPALRAAQETLERALVALEDRFPPTSTGLGIVVGWGLPYFWRHVSDLARFHLPVDYRASARDSRRVPALLDSLRFPSDPASLILEENDVAILLRSDSRRHIDHALRRLVRDVGVLAATSIRRGFTGGGASQGETSLPKRMAMAARIPGAELMPSDAQLFLGFTSTNADTLGRGRIANLETLGYSDGGPDGYFLHGTTMHVSHLFLDLERWYRSFSDTERASRMIGRVVRLDRRGGRLIDRIPTGDDLVRELRESGRVGHSTSVKVASRLQATHVAADGTRYEKGTAVPHRGDFNTLDNPFFWSAQPGRDGLRRSPAAGMHFVVFHPTSDDFHRTRLAMDGVLPDGRRLAGRDRSRAQGVNPVMRTTHRQNFLVPPREHRSFPLVELLS